MAVERPQPLVADAVVVQVKRPQCRQAGKRTGGRIGQAVVPQVQSLQRRDVGQQFDAAVSKLQVLGVYLFERLEAAQVREATALDVGTAEAQAPESPYLAE